MVRGLSAFLPFERGLPHVFDWTAARIHRRRSLAFSRSADHPPLCRLAEATAPSLPVSSARHIGAGHAPALIAAVIGATCAVPVARASTPRGPRS